MRSGSRIPGPGSPFVLPGGLEFSPLPGLVGHAILSKQEAIQSRSLIPFRVGDLGAQIDPVVIKRPLVLEDCSETGKVYFTSCRGIRNKPFCTRVDPLSLVLAARLDKLDHAPCLQRLGDAKSETHASICQTENHHACQCNAAP